MPNLRPIVFGGLLIAALPGATLFAAPEPDPREKEKAAVAEDTVLRARELVRQGGSWMEKGQADQARALFDEAAELHVEPWSFQARCGAILITLRRGYFVDAADRIALLKCGNATQEYHKETLQLLLAAGSGDEKMFSGLWKNFSSRYLPCGNAVVAEALMEMAHRRSGIEDFSGAADFLSRALDYQISDDARRATLYRLFVAHRKAGSPPEKLAGIASRCERWFPDEEKTAHYFLVSARALAESGDFDAALKIWEKIAANRAYPLLLRENAFFAAAVFAEKASRDDVARTMYQSLVAVTGSSASAKLEFGTYLLRNHDLPGATTQFRDLWLGDSAERNVAGARLLQVLILTGKNEEALAVANFLADSPVYGRYAQFKIAELEEAEGKIASAREKYRDIVRRYPDDPYTARSRFRAAQLAARLKDPAAGSEFAEFAALFPQDEMTPHAWLQAMILSGSSAAAAPFFDAMKKNYRESPLFPAAVLQNVFFAIREKRCNDALAILEKYDEILQASRWAAHAGCARLQCLLSEGRIVEADALAGEISEKFSGSEIAAEIAFLAGNAASSAGDFRRALACYRRSRELRPAGVFGMRATGRIADMNYISSFSEAAPEMLASAEAAYRELAENGTDLAIQLEALYQLGRCHEFYGRLDPAADCYRRTLETAAEFRRRGGIPEAIWCYRAAQHGIRIHMHARKNKDRAGALQLCEMLEKLDFPDLPMDFTATKNEILQREKNHKAR